MRTDYFRGKIFSAFLVLLLMGCEATSTGSISINGKPTQIEIKENAPNGLMLYGLDVIINSEFMGTAKRIGKESGRLRNAKIAFEPIASKYGEIRVVQNINSSYSQVGINFDIFVAGAYAGNVQLSNAF